MSFKDLIYVQVIVSGVLTFLAMWIAYTFIVTTAIDRGVDANWAFYLVPIMNAGSVFGRLVPGVLADKTGSITMYCIIAAFTALIATCLWIPVAGQAGMIVFALLFGFGSGGTNTLAPMVLADISDVRMIGLRTGLCYTFTGISW